MLKTSRYKTTQTHTGPISTTANDDATTTPSHARLPSSSSYATAAAANDDAHPTATCANGGLASAI